MSLDTIRARVAFRDRAFVDVLDLALRFMMVHAGLYLRVALVVLPPAFLITVGIARWAGWFAAWTAAVVLSFATQVPFTILASRVVFATDIGAFDVLRASLRDLPRVLVMRTLWVGAFALSSLVFIVPGMGFVGTIYIFGTEALLLERATVGQSFTRSRRIVATAASDAILSLVLVLAVPMVSMLLVEFGGRQIISDLLMFRSPASAFTEGGSILTILGWFVIIPYVATARFFVYLNIRTRAEAWDVQTRFAAIAARTELEEANAR